MTHLRAKSNVADDRCGSVEINANHCYRRPLRRAFSTHHPPQHQHFVLRNKDAVAHRPTFATSRRCNFVHAHLHALYQFRHFPALPFARVVSPEDTPDAHRVHESYTTVTGARCMYVRAIEAACLSCAGIGWRSSWRAVNQLIMKRAGGRVRACSGKTCKRGEAFRQGLDNPNACVGRFSLRSTNGSIALWLSLRIALPSDSSHVEVSALKPWMLLPLCNTRTAIANTSFWKKHWLTAG